MRVWYTKGLSNTVHAMGLLREAFGDGICILASHTATDAAAAALGRDYYDKFLIEPALTGDYAGWLLETALENQVELIIVQRAPHLIWPIRYMFERAGIRLRFASSPDIIEVLDNKGRFGRVLQEMGLPFTPFEVFNDLEEFEAGFARLRPAAEGELCIKPVTGIFGSGFRVLREGGSDVERLLGNAQFEMPLAQFRDILHRESLPGPMMLMPFLPGIERSVDFVADRGKLVAGVARLKHERCQELRLDDASLGFAADLARRFELSGICNLQTRESASGEQVILEVNPRMSGGMQMTSLAGINLPAIDICLGLGILPPPARRRDGVMVALQDIPVEFLPQDDAALLQPAA